MGYRVKVPFEVGIIYCRSTLFQIPFNRVQCLVRGATGAVSVRAVKEILLENRFEHQQASLLNDPVFDGGYPQRSCFAFPFGNVDSFDRLRLVGLRFQHFMDFINQLVCTVLFDFINGLLVDARTAIVTLNDTPRRPKNIFPIDSIIQGVKSKLRLSLCLVSQFSPQFGDFRQYRLTLIEVIRLTVCVFRSVNFFQAVLLSI
jgi:hypothetical protein